MGISINLYRTGNAENIADFKELEKELNGAQDKKIDLYKMTQDLAVIFLNKVDPFVDTGTIPYKMLFGNFVQESVEQGEIGGFIPSSEIQPIMEWINKNEVGNWQGFNNMYESLSSNVKQELEEMGSPSKEEMYNGYVKPLADFYAKAQKEHNSIVIIGE